MCKVAFFLSRLNTCFMHSNYFIFIFRWGWITLKRVNTYSLMSVDNSLATNVFKDMAWKAWMVNTNRMALKILIALVMFRDLIL